MKKPAATQNSNHFCPMKDGKKEHIGGPVLKGSPTVYIEHKMAARADDPLQCQSPNIDKVKKGSSSVFINGKGAARVGDRTAHGGQILTGVKSVFIG